MDIRLKREILDFVRTHDDGSEAAASLRRQMESACCYADVDAYTVSEDDLLNLPQDKLRRIAAHFGKTPANAPSFSVDELQEVADAMSDWTCDDFSNLLNDVVEYDF